MKCSVCHSDMIEKTGKIKCKSEIAGDIYIPAMAKHCETCDIIALSYEESERVKEEFSRIEEEIVRDSEEE